MTTMMKAATQDDYGLPWEVLTVRDVKRPTVGDDDVLVRVRAAGVDQGVWHLVAGKPYAVRLGLGLPRPRNRTPGMDVAGEVLAVGANVTRFGPGDEVFGSCRGSFAEYVSAGQDRFVTKPENITFAQAAAVTGSACTALKGLRDTGKVKAGQRVLVIGAGGGVGTYAVQLAKLFGAYVTAVCSTSKLDLVRSIGADEAIDYTTGDDFLDGTQRYDLILDIAGNRALSALRRGLTPQGTLVIAGGEDAGNLLGMGRSIRASLWSPFIPQRMAFYLSLVNPTDLAYLRELLAAGSLTPVVDRTFSLDRAGEAIRYLRDRHARGKVVIELP